MDDAVELLQTTLAEEKETDETLTAIASELNLVAEAQAAE
jgi:ferritin-like metal-binding protein YciE